MIRREASKRPKRACRGQALQPDPGGASSSSKADVAPSVPKSACRGQALQHDPGGASSSSRAGAVAPSIPKKIPKKVSSSDSAVHDSEAESGGSSSSEAEEEDEESDVQEEELGGNIADSEPEEEILEAQQYSPPTRASESRGSSSSEAEEEDEESDVQEEELGGNIADSEPEEEDLEAQQYSPPTRASVPSRSRNTTDARTHIRARNCRKYIQIEEELAVEVLRALQGLQGGLQGDLQTVREVFMAFRERLQAAGASHWTDNHDIDSMVVRSWVSKERKASPHSTSKLKMPVTLASLLQDLKELRADKVEKDKDLQCLKTDIELLQARIKQRRRRDRIAHSQLVQVFGLDEVNQVAAAPAAPAPVPQQPAAPAPQAAGQQDDLLADVEIADANAPVGADDDIFANV
eukprot:g19362.t1